LFVIEQIGQLTVWQYQGRVLGFRVKGNV
jgi:hypothetical protein